MTKDAEGLKVLVVDDVADIRNYLTRFLARRGCAAEGARDAAEAVARCGRTAYDLVLLDERLPDGEGSAVIAELKRRSPQAYVVLLTGHLDQELYDEARRQGADRCLAKPPDFKELEALVAERLKARAPGS